MNTPNLRQAFAATYREAREQFLAAAVSRGCDVSTATSIRPRAAPKARSSPSTPRCSARRMRRRSSACFRARMARKASAARASRSACCRILRCALRSIAPAQRCCSTTSSIRTASRICTAPTKTTSTSTATSAISRRPLSRDDAYAEVHGFMVPATWPPSPENEAKLAAYVAANGARGTAGSGQRRPVRFSERPVLRRPLCPHGATRRCAKSCVRWRRAQAARLARRPHRPRVHGATARRSSSGPNDPATDRACARMVGQRRHVVLRRLVDVGAADRRQLRGCGRGMPGRRVHRHRAGVRHASR